MNRRDPLRVRNYLGYIFDSIDNTDEYTAGMDSAGPGTHKARDTVIRNMK